MPPGTNVAAPAGSQQILDQGAGAVSVAAAGVVTIQTIGTIFPLLPRMGCRVYNVSAIAYSDDNVSVQLQGWGVGIILYDGSQANAATFWLAGNNFPQVTILDGNGAVFGEDGDPLIELFSAMLLTASTPGGSAGPPATFAPAYMAAVARVSVINNGAGAHVVETDLYSVLLFGAREAS